MFRYNGATNLGTNIVTKDDKWDQELQKLKNDLEQFKQKYGIEMEQLKK